MKNFWSYIKNDKYAVGCTGQTVYVYDNMGNELKKFKDIIYAYTPMFCPNKNIFVVKSTDGRLAVYSLEKMELIKKFRYSKVNYAQDDGFCFSEDGKLFYNIERHINDLNTRLSIYNTESFECIKKLFTVAPLLKLSHIEYEHNSKSFYVQGYIHRGYNKSYSYGFVAKILGEKLVNITELTKDEYLFIRGYKNLEIMGFTQKKKEWSSLKHQGLDLTDIESTQVRLSDYICETN